MSWDKIALPLLIAGVLFAGVSFFDKKEIPIPPADVIDQQDDSEIVDVAESNCPIKGNVSYKTGERIYHTPDCPYYLSTKINDAYGERWFCTEAEARAAGWRKAYNCP